MDNDIDEYFTFGKVRFFGILEWTDLTLYTENTYRLLWNISHITLLEHHDFDLKHGHFSDIGPSDGPDHRPLITTTRTHTHTRSHILIHSHLNTRAIYIYIYIGNGFANLFQTIFPQFEGLRWSDDDAFSPLPHYLYLFIVWERP